MKKNKYIHFDDGSVVLKKERKLGIKELIISIVLALMLFFCLLIIEGKMLNNYQMSEIIVAKCTVPKSLEITNNNVDIYFTKKEVQTNVIPPTAIIDTESLIGKVVLYTINEGEFIFDTRFSEEEKYLSKMKNPLEIGICVQNPSQIVGGLVRKGDLINISSVNSSTKESIMVLKNVYVSKSFDSSGNEIKDGNNIQSLSINIYIDASEEQYFQKTVAGGTLYISKVLSSEKDVSISKSTNSVDDNIKTSTTQNSKVE